MGTAAVASTPTPTVSPGTFSADVDAVKTTLTDLYNSISTNLTDVATTRATMPAVAADGTSATQFTARQLGELQTQQEIQDIKKSVNFDQLAISLSQDINQLYAKRNEVADTIQKKAAVSLWDDPLQAIANAFTMPWDEEQKAGIDESITSRQKQLDAANHNVQNSAATELATTQKLTTEAVSDTAKVMAANAHIAAVAAQNSVYQSQAEGVMKVMTLEKDQLDAYMQNVNMRNNAARLALETSDAQRRWQMYDLQYKKEADKEKADADYLGMVNLGISNSGGTPIDTNRLQTLKQTSGEFVDAMAKQGLILATSPTGSVTQGATIPEILHIQNVTRWKPDPKLPAQLQVMKAQSDAYNAAMVSGSKDKTAVANFAQDNFNETWAAWEKNIDTNNQSNPLIAPSYNTIQKTKLAQNPLWQKYIVPSITDANANLPVDPQRVYDSLSNAVIRKEINPIIAGDFMADIFKQSIAINNTVNRFKYIANKEQTNYNTHIAHLGLGIFDSKSFNIADPNITTNLMVRNIVGKPGVMNFMSTPVPDGER